MRALGAKNGTKVKLVAVGEGKMTTVLTSAAAAKQLPDLMGALSLNGINQLSADDLFDTDAAGAIVQGLGANTFLKGTMELTSAQGKQLAMPGDGFAQPAAVRLPWIANADLLRVVQSGCRYDPRHLLCGQRGGGEGRVPCTIR